MILLNNGALSAPENGPFCWNRKTAESEHDHSRRQEQLYAWAEVMVLIWLKRDRF